MSIQCTENVEERRFSAAFRANECRLQPTEERDHRSLKPQIFLGLSRSPEGPLFHVMAEINDFLGSLDRFFQDAHNVAWFRPLRVVLTR